MWDESGWTSFLNETLMDEKIILVAKNKKMTIS
jgi:hypothetical protein